MAFDKIKEIIIEELNVDAESVKLESLLQEDLEADSLDATELIMAIEEEFDIEISDEVAQNMKTVQDVVTEVEKAIK